MELLQFRYGKKEDILILEKYEKEIFIEPWGLQALNTQIESTNDKRHSKGVFLALYENEIVGYIYFYFVEDMVHIPRIAIVPNHRKQGFGKGMMSKFIEKYSYKGAKEFFLETRLSNKVAQNLYESLGFKNLGIRKNYYSDGEDGVMMSLWIE